MVEFWVYVCIFVKMEYVCKELIGEYKAVVQRPKLKKYIVGLIFILEKVERQARKNSNSLEKSTE